MTQREVGYPIRLRDLNWLLSIVVMYGLVNLIILLLMVTLVILS